MEQVKSNLVKNPRKMSFNSHAIEVMTDLVFVFLRECNALRTNLHQAIYAQ